MDWNDMDVLERDFEDISLSNVDFGQLSDKKVMITGATGLIGSLLVKSLLYCNDKYNLGIKIVACVRNKQKAQSVFGDLVGKNVELCISDLCDGIIEYDGQVDYIIHTASVTNSKMMVTKPVDTALIALRGTNAVLEYAVKNNVGSVIYLSSMEVYGQVGTSEKIAENTLGYVDLKNPRSCYPEGKRMCECLCTAYAYQYDLNVKIARLAQTFGAGIAREENRVFAQFAKSVINNQDIVLHTTGQSEGNYVYTSDAIVAILTVLLKGEKGEAYNVSNEESHMKIIDMAKMVANDVANGKIKVVLDIPDDALKFGYAPDTKTWLDASKLRNLGWSAKVSLREAYTRTIQWLRGLG